MNPKINSLLKRLQGVHDFYSKTLLSLNEDQLSFRLEEGKWNIAEISYHVFLSETLTFKTMMNWSFERKNEKLGFKSKFNSLLTNVFLNSNMKFKAPYKTLEEFPHEIEPVTLLKDWEHKRAQFEDFAKTFDPGKLDYLVFIHPMAGKFNIGQSIGFILYHKIHHKNQIRRIMNSKNFPK